MMGSRSVQKVGMLLLAALFLLQVALSACASGGGDISTATPSAIRLPPQWTETPWPGPTVEAPQGSGSEWAACPDDPSIPLSSLRAGTNAVVTTEVVRPLKLRDIAGWVGSQEVAALQPGQQVEILEGPVCMDQFIWWRVRAVSGVEGWVIEGNQYESWLLPMQ